MCGTTMDTNLDRTAQPPLSFRFHLRELSRVSLLTAVTAPVDCARARQTLRSGFVH